MSDDQLAEWLQHIDIQHFTNQEMKEAGGIEMYHISGVRNPSNNISKPLDPQFYSLIMLDTLLGITHEHEFR